MLADIHATDVGIPVFIILNKDGAPIANSLVMPKGDNVGYPGIPEEIKAFDGLMGKTAPHMTAADRAAIVKWFTEHASKG